MLIRLWILHTVNAGECLRISWPLPPAGEGRCAETANKMNRAQLAQLAVVKFFALLLLLPGLAGLISSAIISTHYLSTMPRLPDPVTHRLVPRGIHGVTIYQTASEDRTLNWLEYSSLGVFVMGLLLGGVYLEKWGSLQMPPDEQEPERKSSLAL